MILGISIAWFLANIIQVFVICRPFASNWDVTITAVCGNRPAAFTAIGAAHMVIDVAIMLLPVHYIRQLQMPTSSKLGICLIFLVGLCICAVSITRMVILSRLDFADISFDMLDSVFWTVVEPALVVVNACLPTTRPLLQSAWDTAAKRVMMISSMTTATGSRKQTYNDADEYPLTPAVDPRKVSHVPQVVASGQADGALSGLGKSGGVHVRTEWSVTDG